MKKRRRFTAEFKAKVELEAIKGQRPIHELAKDFSVHPNQIAQVKRHVLEGSSELFRQGWKKEEEAQSAELERAYRQVGRLPIRGEFVYLTAVMDWYSRYVLSWEVSITMDDSFCVSALERALRRYQKPEIFNSDQGSQYTGAAFTGALKSHHVQISMDGKGRVTDNIMIERLWRSLHAIRGYLHQGLPDGGRARGGAPKLL